MSGLLFENPEQEDLPKEEVIKSNSFWPEITPSDFRSEMRVDNTIPPQRVRQVLINAISSVNHQLRAFRLRHIGNGINTLAEVPAEEVDGKSELIHGYLLAVHCFAKASLLERYSDFDSTGGNNRGEVKERLAGDYLRDAHNAISDIRGQARVSSDLV